MEKYIKTTIMNMSKVELRAFLEQFDDEFLDNLLISLESSNKNKLVSGYELPSGIDDEGSKRLLGFLDTANPELLNEFCKGIYELKDEELYPFIREVAKLSIAKLVISKIPEDRQKPSIQSVCDDLEKIFVALKMKKTVFA